MSYYYIGVYFKVVVILGEMVLVYDVLLQNVYLYMGLVYLNLKERNRVCMVFEQVVNFSFDLKVKEQVFYNYVLCIYEIFYFLFVELVIVFECFLNEFLNLFYMECVNDYLIEVYMNICSYEVVLKFIVKIEYLGICIMEVKQKILFWLGIQVFVNVCFQEVLEFFN